MSTWRGVEHEDVVGVGGNALEGFDGLVYYHDEPTGRSPAALEHEEPFEESVGYAERGEGDDALVDGDLVKGRHEVEQGEYKLFSQEIEDFVDARDEELSEGADGVELLRVDRSSNVSVLFGIATMELDHDEAECWMRPAARY